MPPIDRLGPCCGNWAEASGVEELDGVRFDGIRVRPIGCPCVDGWCQWSCFPQSWWFASSYKDDLSITFNGDGRGRERWGTSRVAKSSNGQQGVSAQTGEDVGV